MRILLAIICFSWLLLPKGMAQDTLDFQQKSQQINRSGMLFLGGWAAGNLTTGLYGRFTHQGQQKYFHEMNAAWNLVNAGIAGLGWLGSSKTQPLPVSEALRQHQRIENLYLINSGLDLLYITSGIIMIHQSSHYPAHADRLRGYGQSIILQGTFLLLFDLYMYGIQNHHRRRHAPIVSRLHISPGSMVFQLP
jgi:hypothetical protein